MKKFSKYIGWDVHKETIAVAVAEGRGGEPRYSPPITPAEPLFRTLLGPKRSPTTPFIHRRARCCRTSTSDRPGEPGSGLVRLLGQHWSAPVY